MPERARTKRQYNTQNDKRMLVPEDYVSIVVCNPLDNSYEDVRSFEVGSFGQFFGY